MANAPNKVIAKSLAGTTATGAGNSYGSRLDAYCGAAIDTRSSKLWTVAAGGHGDYWNNELVYQDLMANSPQWAIHFNGSSGNVVNNNPVPNDPASARYADGLPCSRHTYYQTQFMERHNRAITCGGSISAPGTGYQDIEAFNVDVPAGTNGWDALYTYPGLFGGRGNGGIEPSCCKDPLTEFIYSFNGGRVYRVRPSPGGPISGVAGSGGTADVLLSDSTINSGNEGATAVDTTRNRLIWTHGFGANSTTKPRLLELSNNVISERSYTGVGAADLATRSAAMGIVYVPQIDAYLMRSKEAGGKVYKINANTLEVTFMSTTGGGGVPAGTGSGFEGVFNKWLYVPVLSGVVYVPSASANTWFLRLY